MYMTPCVRKVGTVPNPLRQPGQRPKELVAELVETGRARRGKQEGESKKGRARRGEQEGESERDVASTQLSQLACGPNKQGAGKKNPPTMLRHPSPAIDCTLCASRSNNRMLRLHRCLQLPHAFAPRILYHASTKFDLLKLLSTPTVLLFTLRLNSTFHILPHLSHPMPPVRAESSTVSLPPRERRLGKQRAKAIKLGLPPSVSSRSPAKRTRKVAQKSVPTLASTRVRRAGAMDVAYLNRPDGFHIKRVVRRPPTPGPAPSVPYLPGQEDIPLSDAESDATDATMLDLTHENGPYPDAFGHCDAVGNLDDLNLLDYDAEGEDEEDEYKEADDEDEDILMEDYIAPSANQDPYAPKYADASAGAMANVRPSVQPANIPENPTSFAQPINLLANASEEDIQVLFGGLDTIAFGTAMSDHFVNEPQNSILDPNMWEPFAMHQLDAVVDDLQARYSPYPCGHASPPHAAVVNQPSQPCTSRYSQLPPVIHPPHSHTPPRQAPAVSLSRTEVIPRLLTTPQSRPQSALPLPLDCTIAPSTPAPHTSTPASLLRFSFDSSPSHFRPCLSTSEQAARTRTQLRAQPDLPPAPTLAHSFHVHSPLVCNNTPILAPHPQRPSISLPVPVRTTNGHLSETEDEERRLDPNASQPPTPGVPDNTDTILNKSLSTCVTQAQSRAARLLNHRKILPHQSTRRRHRIPTALEFRSNARKHYKLARRRNCGRHSVPVPESSHSRTVLRAGALTPDQQVVIGPMEYHVYKDIVCVNPWPEDREVFLLDAKNYSIELTGITGPNVFTPKFMDTVFYRMSANRGNSLAKIELLMEQEYAVTIVDKPKLRQLMSKDQFLYPTANQTTANRDLNQFFRVGALGAALEIILFKSAKTLGLAFMEEFCAPDDAEKCAHWHHKLRDRTACRGISPGAIAFAATQMYWALEKMYLGTNIHFNEQHFRGVWDRYFRALLNLPHLGQLRIDLLEQLQRYYTERWPAEQDDDDESDDDDVDYLFLNCAIIARGKVALWRRTYLRARGMVPESTAGMHDSATSSDLVDGKAIPCSQDQFSRVLEGCDGLNRARATWTHDAPKSLESNFYAPTVDLMNAVGRTVHTLLPNSKEHIEFRDGSKRQLASEDPTMRTCPDIVRCERPDAPDKLQWYDLDMFVEVKKDKHLVKDAIRQSARYARALLGHRFDRRFIATLVICGTTARFLLFDRSGLVYSTEVDIYAHTEQFIRAFAGLLLLKGTKAGYNTMFKHFPRGISESTPSPAYRVTVEEQVYDATKILCNRKAIRSRATLVLALRCLWSSLSEARANCSCDERQLIERVLKLIWRDQNRFPEGVILQQFLWIYGLIHVISGDVEFDGCRDVVYSRANLGPGPLTELFGRQEENVEIEGAQRDDLRVLSQVLMECHWALVNRQVEHRDISLNNILLASSERANEGKLFDGNKKPEWQRLRELGVDGCAKEFKIPEWHDIFNRQGNLPKYKKVEKLVWDFGLAMLERVINTLGSDEPFGFLSDLDMTNILSLRRDQASDIHTHRTGTLSFMAVDLITAEANVALTHTYLHDLESFFWVLLYVVAAHLEGDASPNKHAMSVISQLNQFDRQSLGNAKFALLARIMAGKLDVRKFGRSWATTLAPIIEKFAECVTKVIKRSFDSTVDPDANFESVLGIFLDELHHRPSLARRLACARRANRNDGNQAPSPGFRIAQRALRIYLETSTIRIVLAQDTVLLFGMTGMYSID
ncbi:hypothetical protein BDV93DRAFT_514595 [Ceratobasidium sp. AG-I]|nr:hypothetical protein BDV93DRAFT_514595 [Ceratobasidium sp. AG-I]